jgi:hypothetical protein
MEWFKVSVNDLSGAELSAAGDAAIGAWFRMLSNCYRLENGGCYKHCLQHSDRQWLSIAGVDRSAIEVAVSARLARWESGDLMVLGYDLLQQCRATERKGKGREMAEIRWGKKSTDADVNAVSIAFSSTASNAFSTTRGEEKRGEEKRGDQIQIVCVETVDTVSTPPPPASPPVLIFPCHGKTSTWALTQSQLDEWALLFPALDLLDQCRHAKAWVDANPSKRKTVRGMAAFLVGWFTRSQDRGQSGQRTLYGTQPDRTCGGTIGAFRASETRLKPGEEPF